jgi:hypothetical protein
MSGIFRAAQGPLSQGLSKVRETSSWHQEEVINPTVLVVIVVTDIPVVGALVLAIQHFAAPSAGPRRARRCRRRLPLRYGALLATGVVTLVALTLAAPGVVASAVAAQDQAAARARLDRWLVREPPAGFVPAARAAADWRPLADVAVGVAQYFQDSRRVPSAWASVTLWDPTVKPTGTDFALGLTELAFSQGERFDASRVHPTAIGMRSNDPVPGQPTHEYLAVVRHGGLIVMASFVPSPTHREGAITARLRDLVARQLAQPTVPAPMPDVPLDARYVDDLILERPVSPDTMFVKLPALSGRVTTAQLRKTGADEQLIDAVDQFGDTGRTIARHWATPRDGTAVRIELSDEADSLRAGRILDGAAEAGRFDERFDTVSRTLEAGRGLREVILVGRRGRFVLKVDTVGPRPPDQLQRLARRTFDAQHARLPPGATARIANDVGLPELAWSASGLLGALAIVRVAAGRWKRRRRRIRQRGADDNPLVVSVRREARGLRHVGVAMGLALLALAAVALAGLVLVVTDEAGFGHGSPVGLVAFALIPAIVLGARRREQRVGGMRVGFRRPRLVRSVLIATASVAVLAFATLAAMQVAIIDTFGQTLAQVDRERRSGTNAGGQAALTAILVLPLAALLFRVARRQARLRADELRERDTRPQVLYLRGFADDKLKIPTIVSGRRPMVELLSPFPSESYEAIVAWSLDAAGPTVGVTPPGARMGSLGAARARVGSEDWKAFVTREMEASGIIAVSLARTEGLLWELQQLVERNLLDRTLILFPPLADEELRRRWTDAAATLGAATLPLDPASVLVATFAEGRPCAVTADQRDEAGYRMAIIAALERIAARDGSRAASRPRLGPPARVAGGSRSSGARPAGA